MHIVVALLVGASACSPTAPAPAATTAAPPAATSAPAPAATNAPAPAATSAPAARPTAAVQTSGAPQTTAAASDTSSPDWTALVQAAKKDGELVVFLGRAGTRQLKDAFPVFEQKFGIKVTQVAGSGNENADKVLAERDTGIYTADLWMGGLTTINTRLLPKMAFDPIEQQFMLSEVKDRSAWFKGQYSWGDPDKKYTFLFSASPSPLLSYNTDLVKPDEITSFYDLLDPKWKGKIVSRDPTSAGTGGNTAYFYFEPQLGKEFLRRLFTEQDMTIVDDARQAAEWLALGKYPLYLLGSGSDISDAAAQGLPVKDNYGPFKEGARIAAGGTGSLSIFNKAPHPNAAKLFVNWMASPEGMGIHALAEGQVPLRKDVEHPWAKEEQVPKEGVNYQDLYDYTYIMDQKPAIIRRIREIMGQ
jgi:iron(III) transport system substrate-binding protein